MFEIHLKDVNEGKQNLADLRDEVKAYVISPYNISKRRIEKCKIDDHEIILGRLLTSLYFLPIMQEEKVEITYDDFFNYEEAGKLNAYVNHIAERIMSSSTAAINDIKEKIAKAVVKLSDVTTEVNGLKGITVNIFDIARFAKENKEFAELLNFKIPDGLDLNEIENLVNEKVNRAIEILKTADTIYKPLILGGAVNARQLGQTLVNVGLKPDIEGQVIPQPVNTSFFRGLRGRRDFMSTSIGARKALLINFAQVKNSGYLARKLLLLCSEVKLAENVERCDSKHPMLFKISDRKTYDRFVGRYTENDILIDGTAEQYSAFEGKFIKIYSPMTCSCPSGVCKRCYGTLYKVNTGFHIGVIAVLLLTEKLTQMLLSSKHLLMAKTEKVNWPEEFLENFMVDKNNIFSNPETSKVRVEVKDVSEDEDGDLYTNIFYAKVAAKFTKIVSPKKMFLFPETVKMIETSSKEVAFSTDSNTPCFFTKTKNIELGSTLSVIIDLLQKSSHHGFEDDYTGIANELIKRLNESNLSLMAVHAEILLSTLIKDAYTGKRPDFSAEDAPEISVDYVSNAIMESEALSTSFSFEQLKKQLFNVDTYSKTKEGIFDPLYVDN